MEQCPSCQNPVVGDAVECSRCGILFSKWKERESNVESGNLSHYERLDRATSSGFNWTILILFCVTLLGILYFMGQKAIEP